MVGGTSRNVGKTSFTCKIIKKFSVDYKLIGLKIKTIYTGDNFFHGKERTPLKINEEYRITEEKSVEGNEDTSRMLKAGADRVFRIKVKNEYIEKAFEKLISEIGKECFFVCESNSLRTAVKPDLFLMIKNKNSTEMKPSAKKLEKFADKIIFTNGKEHNFDIDNIKIEKNTWSLKFDANI